MSDREDDDAEGYDAAPDETPLQLAKAESRAVWCLRLATLSVLFLTATVICWIILDTETRRQKEDFERAFDTHAAQILSAVEIGSLTRYKALKSFGQDMTSFALARQRMINLPAAEGGNAASSSFTNFPNYARKAFSTVEAAGVIGLIWTPVVSSDDLSDWNAYSVEHSDWIDEDKSFLESAGQQLADSPLLSKIAAAQEGVAGLGRSSADDIPPVVFGWDGSGAATLANSSESYMPVWQFYPTPADPSLVNCDMLSYPFYSSSLRTMVNEKASIFVSRAYVAGNWFPAKILQMLHPETPLTENDGPISNLYIPIYDKFQDENNNVVGVLTTHLIWKTFLENTLPLGSPAPLTVVLFNTCGQNYTFEVEGINSTFLGVGDMHSPSHDDMMAESKLNLLNQAPPDAGEETNAAIRCAYGIRVYPTQALEDEYVDNEPVEFVLFLVVLFLFTTSAFLIYDCIVQRRHRLVMKKAREQTAVVSSLFPQAVREALPSILAKKDRETPNEKTFHASEHPTNGDIQYTMDDSVPVADLYPNCTVLFCDIAGFTSWSSAREPTAVFKLLETMYGAFDRIAEKRGVFKIETIGDCYVAVTGLPNPQEHHAIIMAHFAADCMLALNNLMPLLVAKLGPDTRNLTMRFGLHSGPVTAGVLRGARARFQLFGDTVNTAARMESTGQKGRIQVSQATADILTAAGKGHWLTKREELVEAKGKGSLQTYFVMPTTSGSRTTRSLEADESKQYEKQFKSTMDSFRDDAD